jgi:lipopolysaccharide transport system permease protein
MIIPGAAVLAGLVDFLVALVVVGLTMAWFGVTLTRQIIFLPFLLILTVLLTFGIGLWMAALNVRYRDVRHALPFILQLWMFATPIIYPTSLIPPDWRRLINLNPLTGLIDAYRAVLLGRPIDWSPLLFTSILTLVVLVLAAWYFRRTEEFFADIV